MSDIKRGDLVMLVRGCQHCGSTEGLGDTYIVQEIELIKTRTMCCKNPTPKLCASGSRGGMWDSLDSLKKIDPPTEGESLPVRADKEVTA